MLKGKKKWIGSQVSEFGLLRLVCALEPLWYVLIHTVHCFYFTGSICFGE